MTNESNKNVENGSDPLHDPNRANARGYAKIVGYVLIFCTWIPIFLAILLVLALVTFVVRAIAS